MRKVLIALIGVVALAAVGLAAVLVLGLTGVLDASGLDATLVSRTAYTASELDDIAVAYHTETLILLPSSGDEVVVEEYRSGWGAKDPIAEQRRDGRRLEVAARGEWRFEFLSFWNDEVKVYLPASWPGALQLRTSSGSIRSEDAFSLGSLLAEASSGSVRLGDVMCAGDITMTASSGSVSASRLHAGGDVELAASSGSIRPGEVEGKRINAKTSSGTIAFDGATADTVTAAASSGSVRFGELNGVFDLGTTSGSVEVEDGTGHGSADASSGSVKVTLEALTGDIELESTSGGCRLTVPETAVEVRAKTNSGGVHLPDGGTQSGSGKDVSATYGAAGGYQVSLRASSGSVRLEWR